MTEPIALTPGELEKLTSYLWASTQTPQRERAEAFIALLNKLREPAPLGTVRVSPEGYVAIKYRNHTSEPWWVYRFGTGRNNSGESDEYVADWTTIHKPGESV